MPDTILCFENIIENKRKNVPVSQNLYCREGATIKETDVKSDSRRKRGPLGQRLLQSQGKERKGPMCRCLHFIQRTPERQKAELSPGPRRHCKG